LRAKIDVSRIWQFSAIAARVANSTALRFRTGNAPGKPRQTGQTWVFGGRPKRAEQEQKILLSVKSWTCTSSPITGSKPVRIGTSTGEDAVTVNDYKVRGRRGLGAKEKTAGPTPCRSRKILLFASINSLLQFCSSSEFGYSARGNFDGRACLRIATVARLSLRNRECPKPNQRDSIPLFQCRGNAIHCRVDGSCRLCLVDAATRGYAINEVSFVHRFSWPGLVFRVSRAREGGAPAKQKTWRIYLAPQIFESQL